MGSLVQSVFQRPRFDPLGQERDHHSAHDSIRSLPDLINFNARVNPDHTFCLQAGAKIVGTSAATEVGPHSAVRLSFRELKQAVDSCSTWLEKGIATTDIVEPNADGTEKKRSPVALYLESDVGLFIYLAALLASGTPAVLLSARLSTESVRHLLKETGARSILLSKRTERLIARDVVDLVDIKIAAPFPSFFEPGTPSDARNSTSLQVDEKDVNVLILHSSGTTGLPKPIRLAHRYLLGYAACHRFPEHEPADWLNLSTLPLYHGFGLLAPCLSLSVGMNCVFPPSSIIPAAHSTMDLLSSFDIRSLMTVPSILEDVLNLPSAERSRALSLLRPMRFIAIGGGPLKPEVGAELVADGSKVLNHYGATEIGAIAPIFQPSADYDYRYLRLRMDLGLQLHRVGSEGEETPRFKLVGRPFGWDRPFEIQDELVKRPDSQHVEVKILGRRDDLIVLQNGEKVIPRMLEQALSEDSAIKTAVCVGQGHFEVVVLVEPSSSAPAHAEAFVDHVWLLVSKLNPSLDRHARVSSKSAIVVKPAGKIIPRSDKGSVMRREVQTVFADEISAAYEALELASSSIDVVLEAGDLESGIRKCIEVVMSGKLASDSSWHADDDLFELGMDSLQATRLARLFNSSLERAGCERLTAVFIYRNPSLSRLTAAVDRILRGELQSGTDAYDRGSQMQSLAEEYIRALDSDNVKINGTKPGATVLLTGSTGNLGAHTLACLAQSSRVTHIICLNRQNSAGPDGLRSRQEHINSTAGLLLSSHEWDKISFVAANTQAPEMGLTAEQLSQLSAAVTHIVHLAWPMDFNRQLDSFRPQLNALKTLIDLARSAHRTRPHMIPRIMLASSISVVRHYGKSTVPEEPIDDPLVTTAMGYAEAKWVCERMLQHAGETQPRACAPMIVRIGQLAGPERTSGIWKTEEHVPALIKASQMVSAFPDLKGDFSWLPVDRAARALLDILFQPDPMPKLIYHLENPVRQPLAALGAFVVNELKLEDKCTPFDAWLERMAATGYAASLADFFENDFQALANGNVVLDTSVARASSAQLRGCGGLGKDLIVEYIRRWRTSGFLS